MRLLKREKATPETEALLRRIDETADRIIAAIQQLPVVAVEQAATELFRKARQGFDEHGVHDIRSAAIWDCAAWLTEEYVPRLKASNEAARP